MIRTAGAIVQYENALARGKDISELKVIRGMSQFPNPAPRAGITTKNTIIKA